MTSSALSRSSDLRTRSSSFWLASGGRVFEGFGAADFFAVVFFAEALRAGDFTVFARETRVVRFAVSGALPWMIG